MKIVRKKVLCVFEVKGLSNQYSRRTVMVINPKTTCVTGSPED